MTRPMAARKPALPDYPYLEAQMAVARAADGGQFQHA